MAKQKDRSVPTLKSKIGRVVIPFLPVNRRAFDILRYELRALITTFRNFNPARLRKLRGLNRARNLSINIASGGRGFSGWVNIELQRAQDTTICLDIRRKLPFANDSARRIFAEHIIEHLDFREDIPRIFRRFYQILAPDGVLRIIVPNAERFLEAYVRKDKGLWRDLGWDIDRLPDDIYTPMHVINHIFHQGGEHLFAYDFETLRWALHQAGFATVLRQSFGQSIDPELAIDREIHRPYSLYVDAVKETKILNRFRAS
jgi:predicted SAM-dependent methyltransferase